MAVVEVKVPDIGDFKDVAVIEVLVKVGDTIKAEQSLVTVESDKASMEIPSSHAGVVKELKVQVGDKVNQGSVLLSLEAAGAAAEGVIFPQGGLAVAEDLPASHPQKAVLVAYKRAYEGRFKEDSSAFGGYARDAFELLAKALREVGPDREKVRDAIERTSGFVAVSGIFNFSATDHNGLGLDAFEMLTVKDGKFVVLGR